MNPFVQVAFAVLILSVSRITEAQVLPTQFESISAPPKAEDAQDFSSSKVNLGAGVNTLYSELFPVITPDESVLFFTRKGTPDNLGYPENQADEDIWYSVRLESGGWSIARRLEGPLNTTTFDGVRAINATATRLYLQNIYREDGTRGKGFSISHRAEDGRWLFPEPMNIEDYYNDTSIAMMAVSQAENVIVLSLKRKDGRGKHDLYMSKYIGDNNWSRPLLIKALSTPGDEISPFIAYDDRTLYYSTDGIGGFGGHDIFMTRRLDDTWENWSEPKNLGNGVNTPSFDAYLMVSASGDTAYFSSVHESSTRGFGKSDIWKIALPRNVRAGFMLPTGALASATEENVEAYEGAVFRLDSVYFDVDRSSLRRESVQALDRLVEFLKRFPRVTIEVQGHTDSDAEEEYNMDLSISRAFAVRQFLLNKGIDDSRVEARGYGEERPIAPNTTPAGKQLNRRVMVEITGVK